MQSKLGSYLGLAKRANALVYGYDNIKSEKNVCLIVMCKDANSKLREHIYNLVEKLNLPIRVLKEKQLDDILYTTNCKVVGLINKNFLKPILDSEE